MLALLGRHLSDLITGAQSLIDMKGGVEADALQGVLSPRSRHMFEQAFRLNAARLGLFRHNASLVADLRRGLDGLPN